MYMHNFLICLVNCINYSLKDLEGSMDEDSFFDLLSRFQSKRMDDQRCSLVLSENKENNQLLGNALSNFPASASHTHTSAANVDKGMNIELHTWYY